ncbi:Transcription factor HIVEP3 [Microtus ochrogaster]|uniref:Transcription factor HIVEP3 n=1 Tax=Microtus ochrogaster TaxID=79684 RepID=A0A8J6FZF6_MICOH|nr:Transcription factor HIVEP3 [Microtus ochrogaster]
MSSLGSENHRVQRACEKRRLSPNHRVEYRALREDPKIPQALQQDALSSTRAPERYKSNEEYIYVRGRGRGRYVCEECGIRCKKPSMLKKHIRTHTDVRPYVCKHCHFAFKTKGNLTKHMKSKAHSKKCQETGVLEELEAEEGTSDDLFQDSEGQEGSEAVEEHQFSDLEDSDSDSDLDEEEEEEEDESQDELSRPSSEAAPPCLPTTLQEDSSPLQGPQPPVTTSDEVQQGSSISEATHLTASSCSTPSRGTPDLLRLGPAPVETDMSSALSSKAMSPRRPWSPSKEAGSRPSLTRKHSLSKNDSSPQRWSPTQEVQASVTSTPGPQVGPGRIMGPRLCGSPRLELSPLTHYPIVREVPPWAPLSPGPKSAIDTGAPRYSPTRKWSLGQAESSPQTGLPGKWALAGPCSPSVGKCSLGLGPAPQALLQPVPLPHTLLSRSPEMCTSVWQKTESRSPSCSAGPVPLFPRPFSAPHDFHGHLPSRSEENLFSHLPLHSQHLSRVPCPLIPIGGIQMVQARPGAHPTLLPAACVAWVTSGFSGGGSDLTGAREAQERSRWSPTESASASVSPVANVSKFTLSSELEEERTSRGPGRPPDWAPQRAEAPAEPMGTHSPCSPQLPQGHQGTSSWGAPLESPHTLANRKASSFPPLDRSSSVDCLAEASTHFPARSRNLSGEPRTRQGSPEPLGSGEPRTPQFLPKDRGPPST